MILPPPSLNWSRRRAFQVGEHHYDIGNDVYAAMLDPLMFYSGGYWKEAVSLEEAQHAKLRLIGDKLELSRGESLLDIGCGWGGLARYMVERYGVSVTGITISREQASLARERCASLPVDIHLMDYRELAGRFDKLVSVGMFEHVGPCNYSTFFAIANRVMAPHGLVAQLPRRLARTDPPLRRAFPPHVQVLPACLCRLLPFPSGSVVATGALSARPPANLSRYTLKVIASQANNAYKSPIRALTPITSTMSTLYFHRATKAKPAITIGSHSTGPAKGVASVA